MDRKPSQDKPITITHDDDRARLCAPCFRLGIAARITLTRVHRALRTAFLLSLLRQGYSVKISFNVLPNENPFSTIFSQFS